MGPLLAAVWPFLASLIAVNALAQYVGNRRMAGTALVLLLNWTFCTAFVAITGEDYPVRAFATADYLAGFAILVLFPLGGRKPTMWEGVVGIIYAFDFVVHAARAIVDSKAAVYYGYHFLKWASWAQLAVVASWGAYALAMGSGKPLGSLPFFGAFLGNYRQRVEGVARKKRATRS